MQRLNINCTTTSTSNRYSTQLNIIYLTLVDPKRERLYRIGGSQPLQRPDEEVAPHRGVRACLPVTQKQSSASLKDTGRLAHHLPEASGLYSISDMVCRRTRSALRKPVGHKGAGAAQAALEAASSRAGCSGGREQQKSRLLWRATMNNAPLRLRDPSALRGIEVRLQHTSCGGLFDWVRPL